MNRSLSAILTDPERLDAVRRVALADASAEEAFDRLARLTARILGAPIALVTIVDEKRQVFRGCAGLPEPWASRRETPLSHSFCQHALVSREPLVIEDAREHPLLRENLAIPDLGVVAYAGIPLVTSAGHALGSVCAIDHVPRRWTEEEISILRDVAASVMSEVELLHAAHAIEREQERRLAVLEATDQGIYGIDRQGRCTFINRAGAALLGYSVEELMGRSMHLLTHHHRADGTPFPEEQCPILGTLKTGEGIRMEDDVLWRRDGSRMPVEYGAYPVMQGEEVRGAVVTFQDLTEWKRTQQRVAAQHAVARVLAESPTAREACPRILAAIGERLGWPYAALWEAGGSRRRLRRIAAWQDPFRSAAPTDRVGGRTSYAPGEGLAGRVWETGEPVWVPDLRVADQVPRSDAAVAAGLVAALAVPVRSGSDFSGVLELFTTEVVEPDPALTEAMLSIGSSIGHFLERQRAEASLRQSEDRYRRLVELSPDAILVQRDGEVLYANPEAARLFGARDRLELVGRSAWDLVHPSFQVIAMERVRQVLATGEPAPRIEEKFRKLDGAVIHVEVAGNAIRWAGRRAVQVVIRDVSERKRSETERMRLFEEARVAQREAETANRAKSQFLATMSHEIRTPVNAIVGYTDLLEMEVSGPINAAQRAQLERVRSSSEHLIGLIDDVLDLAKVEAGRITVEQEPALAREAVEAALALIIPQAAAREIRIRDGCAERETRYVGDADRVRQILVNLLSNAVKFTPPDGTITLECGSAATVDQGAEVEREGPWTWIRVTDTGIGITSEQATRIFAPFVQAEMGHTRAHEGTGLGLTISRELARLMGGDLTLRSTPGEGSAFTVWLPCDAEPEPDAMHALEVGSDRVLRETGALLSGSIDAIVTRFVQRLRSDAEIPHAEKMADADLVDHTTTLLGDVARSLAGAGGSTREPERLLRDGTRIQRVIAELHGEQRARSGWTERALAREYEHLREEVAAALRNAPEGGAHTAEELLLQAEHHSRGALRTAGAG